MEWIDPIKQLPKDDQLCWIFILGRETWKMYDCSDYENITEHSIELGLWRSCDSKYNIYKDDSYKEVGGYWHNIDQNGISSALSEECIFSKVVGWLPFKDIPLPHGIKPPNQLIKE